MLSGGASPLSRLDGAGAAVSAGAPSDGDGRSDCDCSAPHALSTQIHCNSTRALAGSLTVSKFTF